MSSVGHVKQTLKQSFESANIGSATRTLVVKIDPETEEIAGSGDGRASVSIQRDYQQLQTFADMYGPCWFLVKHAAKDWRIYTYCPDSESVKTKMLYSSAKETLIQSLGQQHFTTQLHASTKEELLYARIEESQAPAGDSVLSKWELEHKAVLRAESDEAKQRGMSTPKGGDGIGGYHTVNVPLSPSAKNMMADFNSGSASFVELKISEDKNTIEGVSKGSVSGLAGVSAKLNKNEPRFYLIASGASKYMLYLCPDKSQISVRMVYSTAKPAVVDASKACGIRFARVVEATDAADVEPSLFSRPASYAPGSIKSYSPASQRTQEPEWMRKRNEMRLSASPRAGGGGHLSHAGGGDGGGTRADIQIKGAHPTAQLLGNQVSGSPGGPKKKIVVPPQGAW